MFCTLEVPARGQCGRLFASSLWGLLPRELLAKSPGSKGHLWLRPGLSDGDCASAEIVGLKGSFCTPAAWRERRNLQCKGSVHRGHETEQRSEGFSVNFRCEQSRNVAKAEHEKLINTDEVKEQAIECIENGHLTSFKVKQSKAGLTFKITGRAKRR